MIPDFICNLDSMASSFSGVGLVLGFLGLIGGMLYLSFYPLAVISKDAPDIAEFLLGRARVAALKGR